MRREDLIKPSAVFSFFLWPESLDFFFFKDFVFVWLNLFIFHVFFRCSYWSFFTFLIFLPGCFCMDEIHPTCLQRFCHTNCSGSGPNTTVYIILFVLRATLREDELIHWDLFFRTVTGLVFWRVLVPRVDVHPSGPERHDGSHWLGGSPKCLIVLFMCKKFRTWRTWRTRCCWDEVMLMF